MSGIAGVFNLNRKPVDQAELERMSQVLEHRGPDGCGLWHSEHVGMSYQKLITTPESRYEWLPMTNRQGSLMLTADVRLDNRAELIEILSLAPSRGNPITDAEIVLAAYSRWGVRCAKKLIGAFAFAIWDEVNQQLYCARDHYGLKPFYFAYLDGKRFAFASEIKAILQLEDIPRMLNEKAIADHLMVPIKDDSRFTFYKHISRLEAGHYLIANESRLRIAAYWDLDPTVELRLTSDMEYAEALREKFTEAVHCRLRSAYPLGAMLSGGLDSSSIVGVAAPKLGKSRKSLHTFSAVFDTVTRSDERPFIDAVIRKYDPLLLPHILRADTVSPLYAYNDLLRYQDSAVQAGNMYFFWKLYEKAHDEGVRVILDGFDGDTTLSHGVGYLHELAHTGRWIKLYREVKKGQDLWGLPWEAQMWKWIKVYGLVPAISRIVPVRRLLKGKKRLKNKAGLSDTVTASALTWNKVLNTEFVRQVNSFVRSEYVYPKTEREMHYRLLKRPVMQRIIETWEASASAAGMELRLPFCDRRLMEFCLSMPAIQKRRDGWTRVAMRRAMTGILPESIQWRPTKGNLAPGFDHGLLVRDPKPLERMISQDTGGIGRYVDLPCLARSLPTYNTQVEDNNTAFHWRALSLALWLNYTGL